MTEVAQRVRELVADALARDVSEVSIDSVLMSDLGAESLDFLDLVFKLEHEFHIQITRGEMERAARGVVAFLESEFAPLARQRVVIFCGQGNNGGGAADRS